MTTAALLKADPGSTIGELADELADELARLETLRYDDGSGADAPSVAAAFELSYRLLDETGARVFRLLPINPGPDVSTAAATVLADLLVGDLRKVLSHLARAHLIEAAPGARGRWRMHDLLHLYARQLSDAHAGPDGREEARDRLLHYYMETARAADAHLRPLPGRPLPTDFTDRDSALSWMDAERPNLVAAVSMAATTGRDPIAMLLPHALPQYLGLRRRFDDLLAIVTVSRDAARRQGDRAFEAAAVNDLGITLQTIRRFEEAITAYQEAAAIFREIDEPLFEGMVLNHLGIPLRETRRFEGAATAHQSAVAIFRQADDRRREGNALGNLGVALGELGRFEEAIAAHQGAAAISRETDDRQREGMALTGLGNTLRDMGRFEESATAHRGAVAIFRETSDCHSEAMALNNLGLPLRDMGQFEEAIAAHQGAAAIFREIDDEHSESTALYNVELDKAEQI